MPPFFMGLQNQVFMTLARKWGARLGPPKFVCVCVSKNVVGGFIGSLEGNERFLVWGARRSWQRGGGGYMSFGKVLEMALILRRFQRLTHRYHREISGPLDEISTKSRFRIARRAQMSRGFLEISQKYAPPPPPQTYIF